MLWASDGLGSLALEIAISECFAVEGSMAESTSRSSFYGVEGSLYSKSSKLH